MGNAGLRLTVYFFEILKKLGVSTHYVSSDIDNNIMTVKPATVFGKGLEVICRYKVSSRFKESKLRSDCVIVNASRL